MSNPYNPAEIEPKWQQRWEQAKLYRSVVDWNKPKHYALTMLPYPSGDMHIGHWFVMTASDARARYKRMTGYNVLFPMGFDAFGLPAEQAAVQRNIHPKKWTYSNMKRQRGQIRSMGMMIDWEREAVSCDPSYYQWTQWFFKKLYEYGLAYRGEGLVNWSDALQTVLANEQVIDGKDERLGQPVIQKMMTQWFFRVTKYAEELLDFGKIDWPEPIKIMQANWIGRSEGAFVTFRVDSPLPSGEGPGVRAGVRVFTTRPDTLWGATFMVLAPEHPLVEKITTADQRPEVEAYIDQAAHSTEIQRSAEDREKTGVFTGAYAINPVNQERIPIWIADYVMITYGSGAIMAVPAHDERDFAFALKYGLPIIPVIARNDGLTKSFTKEGVWVRKGFAAALDAVGIAYTKQGDDVYVTLRPDQVDSYIDIVRNRMSSDASWTEIVGGRWEFIFHDAVIPFDSVAADREIMERCRQEEPAVADKRTVMEMLYGLEWYRDALFHTDYGAMIHSGDFTGTPGIQTKADGSVEYVARTRVTQWLESQGFGQGTINYRLRDWLISRQRYWGAPIPMIHRQDGRIEAVPEADLPVLLPEQVQFKPTGQSPLKYTDEFRVTVDSEGHPAERETDTMDTFMCSSWYQYRYLSPKYAQAPFDPEEAAYWLPVDTYTGGAEHATMHLLYTRFFTKAMRDMGVFEATARIMREHGRNPEGLFDEPMLQLRNQGQILGAERSGDFIMASGRFEERKLYADHVRVIDSTAAPQSFDGVVGEIRKRTENLLLVNDIRGEQRTVEVVAGAKVEIPSIEGETDVTQLRHHLEIQRMSKSKGNVVDPDEQVAKYGADAVRAYLMFNYEWTKGGPWNEANIKGPAGWIYDVWDIVNAGAPSSQGNPTVERDIERKLHQTIAAVQTSLENFSFNTAISTQMKFKNFFRDTLKAGAVGAKTWRDTVSVMLRLMAPVTPHVAEELWERTGFEFSVHQQSWPVYDATKAAEEMVTLVVMVGGKPRQNIPVAAGIEEVDAIQIALASDAAKRALNGREPKKVIFIPGRQGQEPKVNIVV